jgi:serine/threonine protein kinase
MRPKHFDMKTIQAYSKQILKALEKMHSLHIIHSDLKPENILIKSYSKQELKVIDIGSSIFFHDKLSFYIQTRSYRAPEVILGCPFD